MLCTIKVKQKLDIRFVKIKHFFALYESKHYIFLQQYFVSLLAMLMVGYSLPTIALEHKLNQAHDAEVLQTNITQNDISIIEELVTIAERNSSEVLEAKSAMGWSAFQDVLSIELSPSLTTTSYNAPDGFNESESSLYLSITLDPIKLISAFEKQPIFQARLHEAKQQKRLAVMRYYLAYLQARQAVKIAAYRMQNLTTNERIASFQPLTHHSQNIQSLANADYVAAATEILNSNVREKLALEELAACVGISTSAMMNLINGR